MASNDAIAERSIPKWIKAELFEPVFKEIISGYRQVQVFDVKEALTPGENYATIMLRIHAEIELIGKRYLETFDINKIYSFICIFISSFSLFLFFWFRRFYKTLEFYAQDCSR